jgi:hypothetical protein
MSAVSGNVRDYLLVRWKRRWFVVPLVAIWIPVATLTQHRYRSRDIVAGALTFAIASILWPLRLRGEK